MCLTFNMKITIRSIFLITGVILYTILFSSNTLSANPVVSDSIKIVQLCESARLNITNYKDSESYINRASEIAETTKCESCYGEILSVKAFLYSEHGKFDSALNHYDLALAKFKEDHNDTRAIETIIEISKILDTQYKFEEAANILKDGLNIGSNNDSTLTGLKADLYLNLGLTFEELALFRKSIDALIKALEIYEVETDSSGVSSCLISLGSLLMTEENFTDALEYTERALEIGTLLNDSYTISASLNNIGYIYSYTQKQEEALNYFKRSLEIDRQLNDRNGVAICLNNIGDTYKELGDTILAVSYYSQSLETARPDNNLMIAVVLINIAELEYVQGNLKSALAYANEGLAAAIKSTSLEQLLESYSLLQRIYSEMGRYEKAYFYLSAHQNIHDSIYSISKTRYIQEVNAKYNDEKQRSEINILKEKNIDEYETKKYLLITILGISIIIVSMFVVINVIRRSSKLVKKQKKYYERLLEYSEDFIFVIDKKGVTKYISPSYERRIGRETKERTGMSAFEFIHSDDVDFVMAEFQGLIADKRPRNINFRMENAFGEWLTVYAFGQNMMDDPMIEGIVVNFWDITQLKEAEELISQSEIKFREIFNSFPDIYFQTDVKGVITEISPSVFELIGYTREELLGVTPYEYYHFIDDWKKIAARLEANSMVDDHDTKVKTKNGKVINCSFSAENIYDDKNNHLGMKGVIRDISGRVNNQRRLHQSQVKLREANKAKEKIFSIIAHDLIGPIGTNKSIVDLIVGQVDELTNEEVVTLITSLKPSLDSTYSLIENLLSWARIQQNKIVPNFENIHVGRMLELISEILNGQALRKSVKMDITGDEEIKIFADQNQMDIVFRNLISNAIKFSKHNTKIKVSYAIVDSMAEIRISDSGIGMSKKEVNKILSGKGNVEARRGTDNEKGTGFGLVIVTEFIKNNSGKINILSEEGKGTTFILSLPLGTA